MKKAKACLLIIGIVILLLITGFVISRVLPTTVTLSSLQKGDIYQFKNLSWGLSENAVKLLWTDTLKDFYLPEQEVLQSRDSGKIDGKDADVYFYFQDDKLFQIALTVKDCDEAWFNELLEDARQLYGEETKNVENQVYRWNQNNTSLSLSAPNEHANQVLVVIGEINEAG